MKLHLPSGLRKALLACLAAVALPAASIPTTIASASGIAAVFLATSQRASAEGSLSLGTHEVNGTESYDSLSVDDDSAGSGNGGLKIGGEETVTVTGSLSGTQQKNLRISGGAGQIYLKGGGVMDGNLNVFDGATVYIGDSQTLSVAALGGNTGVFDADGGGSATLKITGKAEQEGQKQTIESGVAVELDGSAVQVLQESTIKGKLTLGAGSTLKAYKKSIWSDDWLELDGLLEGTGTIQVGGTGESPNTGKLIWKGTTNGATAKLKFDGIGTLELHRNLSVSALSFAEGAQSATITSGKDVGETITLSLGTITVNEGGSAITIGINGGVLLDFSDITIESGNGKLTINLTGYTSQTEFQLFSGSSLFATWFASHHDDWSSYIDFQGLAAGRRASLNTDGSKVGYVTISATGGSYTYDGTSDLTWQTDQGSGWTDGGAWEDGGIVQFTATSGVHTVTLGGDVSAAQLEITQAGATYNFTGNHTLTLEEFKSSSDIAVNVSFSEGTNVHITKDMTFKSGGKSELTFGGDLIVDGKVTVWGGGSGVVVGDNASQLTLKKGGTFKQLDVSWRTKLLLGDDLVLTDGFVFDGNAHAATFSRTQDAVDTQKDVYVVMENSNSFAIDGGESKGHFEFTDVGLKVRGTGHSITLSVSDWNIGGNLAAETGGALTVGTNVTVTGKLIVDKTGTMDLNARGITVTAGGASVTNATDNGLKIRNGASLKLTEALSGDGQVTLWGGLLTLEKGGKIGSISMAWGQSSNLDLVLGADLELNNFVSGLAIQANEANIKRMDNVSSTVYVLFNIGDGGASQTLADFYKRLKFNDSKLKIDDGIGIGKTGTGKLTITEGGTLEKSLKIKQGDMEFQGGVTFNEDVVLAGGNAIFSGVGDNGDETSSNTVTGKLDVTSGSLTLGKASLTLNGGISGSLTNLTLGSESVLDVKSGTLTLTGKLSFEAGSKIKLSTNDQQITLPETALDGVSGKKLAIELSSTFIASQGSGAIKLFSYWKEEWDNLFTFSVEGDSGTYTDIHVDGGNLVWGEEPTPSDSLYWGKGGEDTSVTLGGDESNEWSDTSEYSSAGSTPWATGKDVYLEATSGAVDVTVGANANMASLTIRGGATYTLTPAETTENTLTVQGDLALESGASFAVGTTVGGVMSGSGALTVDGKTFTLSGADKTHTWQGRLTVQNAGTFDLASSLTATDLTVGMSGGTVKFSGSSTQLTVSGTISGEGNTLTLDGSGKLNWTGSTGSLGGITMTGGGEFAIGSGTLTMGGDINLGQNGKLSGSGTISKKVDHEGDVYVQFGASGDVNEAIGSWVEGKLGSVTLEEGVSLQKTGGGTLTFKSGGTLNKALDIADSNSVKFDGNSYTVSEALTGAGTLIIATAGAGRTVTLGKGANMTGDLALSCYAGSLTLGANATFGGLTCDGNDFTYLEDSGREHGIKKSGSASSDVTLTLNVTKGTGVEGVEEKPDKEAKGVNIGAGVKVVKDGEGTQRFTEVKDSDNGRVTLAGGLEVKKGVLEIEGDHSTISGALSGTGTEGTLRLASGNLEISGGGTHGGTLEMTAGKITVSGQALTVGSFKATTGALDVQSNLTINGVASGGANLSSLTLGGSATLEVKDGDFTIADSWGWTAGAQLTLGTGVQITLSGSLSFAGGVSGGNRLTINLSKAYLDALIGDNDPDTVAFFAGGWQNDQSWEDYFTFNVTGDTGGTYKDLKLSSDGKLTWTKAEVPTGDAETWNGTSGSFAWGTDAQWTIGGESGQGYSADKNVVFKGRYGAGDATIQVTLAGATTVGGTMTLELADDDDAQAYNFTLGSGQSLTVNETLTIDSGITAEFSGEGDLTVTGGTTVSGKLAVSTSGKKNLGAVTLSSATSELVVKDVTSWDAGTTVSGQGSLVFDGISELTLTTVDALIKNDGTLGSVVLRGNTSLTLGNSLGDITKASKLVVENGASLSLSNTDVFNNAGELVLHIAGTGGTAGAALLYTQDAAKTSDVKLVLDADATISNVNTVWFGGSIQALDVDGRKAVLTKKGGGDFEIYGGTITGLDKMSVAEGSLTLTYSSGDLLSNTVVSLDGGALHLNKSQGESSAVAFTLKGLEGTSTTSTITAHKKNSGTITLTLSDSANHETSATLSAEDGTTFDIVKTGEGTQTFKGGFTAGTVTLDGGGITLENANGGSVGSFALSADTTLTLNIGTYTAGNLSGTSGTVTGSGTLHLTAQTGSFTGTFSANLDYAGTEGDGFTLMSFTGSKLTVTSGVLTLTEALTTGSRTVTLDGGTLKLSAGGTIDTLSGTGGALDIAGNTTITSAAGAVLTSLTLAGGAELTVSAGDFGIKEAFTWGANSALKLGSKITIDLDGVSSLTVGESGHLKIYLTTAALEDGSGTYQLFSHWNSKWNSSELFDFYVGDEAAAGTYEGLKVRKDGKLVWGEAANTDLYFGGVAGETDLTWGGTSGGKFDTSQESSDKQSSWNDVSDVHFVGDGSGTHDVKLADDIQTWDMEVSESSSTWNFGVADSPETATPSLTVEGNLSVSNGAKVTFDEKVSLSVAGDVKLEGEGSTLTLYSDMVFGGKLSGEGSVKNGKALAGDVPGRQAEAFALAADMSDAAGDTAVYALWDNSETPTIKWSELQGQFGNVLDDDVDYGVSLSTDLTVSEDASIDKAFKVKGGADEEGKKMLTFSGTVTLAEGGNLVLEDYVEVVFADTGALKYGGRSPIEISHVGEGTGTITLDLSGGDRGGDFSQSNITFGEGVTLHVKAKSGDKDYWSTLTDLKVLGGLSVEGRQVALNGDNTIGSLTVNAAGMDRFCLADSHGSTTINAETTINALLDFRKGTLNMGEHKLTLGAGLCSKNAGYDYSGEITGKDLEFTGSATQTWKGSLNLQGTLTMSGGTQTITGQYKPEKSGSTAGELTVNAVEVKGGKLIMSGANGAKMDVTQGMTISGGEFEWAGTAEGEGLTVGQKTTLSGLGILTFSGGKNKLTEGLEGSSGGTLKVEGGTLDFGTGGLTGTLTGLTLGKDGTGVELTSGGDITLSGTITLIGDSKLNFASIAKEGGQKLTLDSSVILAEGSSGHLQIVLTSESLQNVSSGDITLVNWGGNYDNWKEYITLDTRALGEEVTTKYAGIHIDRDGKLVWTSAEPIQGENMYWNGSTEVGLGSTSAGVWSEQSGQSGTGAWTSGKNVYLEAAEGSVAVNVGDGATMKTLTVGKEMGTNAQYTFSGSQTLTVTEGMTIYDDSTFGTGVTVAADGTAYAVAVKGGTTKFEGDLTAGSLTISGADTVVELNGGSVNVKGTLVLAGDGKSATGDGGIVLADGATLKLKPSVFGTGTGNLAFVKGEGTVHIESTEELNGDWNNWFGYLFPAFAYATSEQDDITFELSGSTKLKLNGNLGNRLQNVKKVVIGDGSSLVVTEKGANGEDLFSMGTGHELHIQGTGTSGAKGALDFGAAQTISWAFVLDGNATVSNTAMMTLTGELNAGTHTLTKKGTGTLELGSNFSTARDSSGTIAVTEGTLVLNNSTNADALENYTIALSGSGTLQSGITGTVGTLNGTGTLNITGGKLTLSNADGATLTNLQLAASAELAVSQGSFTISNGWTWGADAKLTLSTSGQVITLTDISQLNNGDSDDQLTIHLDDAFFGSVDGGTGVDLFSGFKEEWVNYFRFETSDNYTDVKLSNDGKFTWVKMDNAYWGGGDGEGTLNWGGDQLDSTASGGEKKAWKDGGSMNVTFVGQSGGSVSLTSDITTGSLSAEKGDAGSGGSWEFSSSENDQPRKLTVKKNLTAKDGADLTFSKDVQLTVDGNVTLGAGSTLTLGSDMSFGGTLSGEGTIVGSVFALYTGGGSMSWGEFTGKYGSVLGTGMGYGAGAVLTITDDAALDKAFKAGDNTTVTFNGGVTVSGSGSIVLGDKATITVEGTLKGSVTVTHEGTETGTGTLAMKVGENDRLDLSGMTFQKGVVLHIDAPTQDASIPWGTIQNLNVLGELELKGHEVILSGTNQIEELDTSDLTGKFTLDDTHESTTINKGLDLGVLLDLREGGFTVNGTLTLQKGMKSNSTHNGSLTADALMISLTREDEDQTIGLNSLTVTNALTMSGTGKQTINGTTSMSAGSLTVSGGELVLGGCGITVSGDATLSGGKLTLSGTSSLGTLKKAEGGSGNLEVTSGSLTIGSIEKDASLGTLTLGQGVSLTVGGDSSKLTGDTLSATQGASLTLTMMQGGGNLSFTTLNLGEDGKLHITLKGFDERKTAIGAESKEYQLFDAGKYQSWWTTFSAGHGDKTWSDFFEFTVDGYTLEGLSMDGTGKLTWTETKDGSGQLYWEASSDDHEITLGSGEGAKNEWSYKSNYDDPTRAWEADDDVYLAAEGVDVVSVTVGTEATMKSLSFEGAATYTLTGGEASVEGTLTNNATKVSVGSDATLTVGGYSGSGVLEIATGGTFKPTADMTVSSLTGAGGTIDLSGGAHTLTVDSLSFASGTTTVKLGDSGVLSTDGYVDGEGADLVIDAVKNHSSVLSIVATAGGTLNSFNAGVYVSANLSGTWNFAEESSLGNLHTVKDATLTLKLGAKFTLHGFSAVKWGEGASELKILADPGETDANRVEFFYDCQYSGHDVWLNSTSGQFLIGDAGHPVDFTVNHIQETDFTGFGVPTFTLNGNLEIRKGILKFYSTKLGTINGQLSGAGTLSLTNSIFTIGKDDSAGSLGTLEFRGSDAGNNSTVNLAGDLTVKSLTSAKDDKNNLGHGLIEKGGAASTVYLLIAPDEAMNEDVTTFVGRYSEVTLGNNVGYGVNVTGTATLSEGGQLGHAFKAKVASSGKLTLSGTTQYDFAHGLMLDGGTVELTCTGGLKVGGAAEGTPFFSWADGTTLTVSASQGITIDLTGLSTLNDGNSTDHELTLNLTSDFLEAASAGGKSFKLFNLGVEGIENFSQYFTLQVDGVHPSGTYGDIKLNDDGTLEWGFTPAGPGLYWGQGDGEHSQLTLGGEERIWSEQGGSAGEMQWAPDMDVYLEAQGGGKVAVTVADGASMANLTLQSGATYTFGGEALAVTETLTANTSATFGVAVSAKELVVNAEDGAVEFSSGLTLTNGGEAGGLTITKGSVTFSGGTVNIGKGSLTQHSTIGAGASLTVEAAVKLECLGLTLLENGATLTLKTFGEKDEGGLWKANANNSIVWGDGTLIFEDITVGVATNFNEGFLPGGTYKLGELVLRNSSITTTSTRFSNVTKTVVESGSSLAVSAATAFGSNSVHIAGTGGEAGAALLFTGGNGTSLANLVLDADATISNVHTVWFGGTIQALEVDGRKAVLTKKGAGDFEIYGGTFTDLGKISLAEGSLTLTYDEGNVSKTSLSGTVVSLDGGVLKLNKSQATADAFTLKGLEGSSTVSTITAYKGNASGAITLTLNDSANHETSATLSADAGTTFDIVKTGKGTQTFKGGFTAGTVTLLDGGGITLENVSGGSVGSFVLDTGTTLTLNNGTYTAGGLSGDGDITGNGTLELTAESGSFDGSIGTNFTYNATTAETGTFTLNGEFTGANLTVQKGTLEAALSSGDPGKEVTLAQVTLAGGTLKVSEKLTVTALNLTAGSGLDVQKNLTVTTLTGGENALTSLSLAAGAALDVQNGGFKVNGEWSWGKDSSISLGVGQQITLGEDIDFKGVDSETKLTFKLTPEYLKEAKNGETDFFAGGWQTDQGATWKDYFAFEVSGGTGNWKDLHLNENGKLAWTKKEGLEWKGGSDNTWSGTETEEWKPAEGDESVSQGPNGQNVYFTEEGATEGEGQVSIQGTVRPADVHIQGGEWTFGGAEDPENSKLEATGKLTVAEGAGLTLDVESSFKGVDLYGSLELDESLTISEDDESKIKFLGGTLTYASDLDEAADLSEKVATEDEGSTDAVKVAVSDSVTGGVTWGSGDATVGGEEGNGGLTLALDENGIEKSGEGNFTLAWQDDGTKHEGGITVTKGNLALDVNGSTELSGDVTGSGTLKVTGGAVTLSGENTVKGIEVDSGATLTAGSSAALGGEGTTLTLNGGTLKAQDDLLTVESGKVEVKDNSTIEGTVSLSGKLTADDGKKLTAGEDAEGMISGSLENFNGTLDTASEGSSWTLSGEALEGGGTVGVSGSGTVEFDGAATYSGKVDGSVTLASGEDGLTITSTDVSADAKLNTGKGAIVLGDKDQEAKWQGKTVTGGGNLTLSHVELTNGKDMNLGGSTLNINTTGDVSLGGMQMNGVTLGTVTVNAGDTVRNLRGKITAEVEDQFKLFIDENNVGGKTRAAGDALFDAGRDGGLTLNVEKAEAFRLDFSNDGLMEYIHDILDGDQNVAIHIVKNGELILTEDLWKEIEADAGGNWQLLKDLGMKITAVDGGDIILTGLEEFKMYLVDGKHDPEHIGGGGTATGYGVLAGKDATLLDANKKLTLTLTGTAEESGDATPEEKIAGGAIVHNLLGLEGSEFDVENYDGADGAKKKLVLDNTHPSGAKDQEDVPEWVDPRPIGQDTTFMGTIQTAGGIDIEKTGAGTLTVGSESGTGGLLMGEDDTLSITGGALKLRGDRNNLGNVELANEADAVDGEKRGLILDGGNATVFGNLTDKEEDKSGDVGDIVVNNGGELTLKGEENVLNSAGITGDGSGTITLAETTDNETGEVTGASLKLADGNGTLSGVGVNLDGENTELDIGQGSKSVTELNGNGTLRSKGGVGGAGTTLTVGGGTFSGTLGLSDDAGSTGTGTLVVADGASFTLDNANSEVTNDENSLRPDPWNVRVGRGSELTIDVSKKNGTGEDGTTDKLTLGDVDLGNGKTTVNYGEKGYRDDVIAGRIVGDESGNGTIDFHSDKPMSAGEKVQLGFTIESSIKDTDKFVEEHVTFSGLDGFLNDHDIKVDSVSGKITVEAKEVKENGFERVLPNMAKNAHAGATMVWDSLKDKRDTFNLFFNAWLNPESDSSRMIYGLVELIDNGENATLEKALTAVAGSSISTLGPALSEDLHRQLTTIRNRTTTMANELRYDGYDEFPQVHAWINGEGAYRKLDADGFAPGYTINSWGGTVGMDVDIEPGTTIGLALSAMYGDLKTDSADIGKGDLDTSYVSLFARTFSGAWTHTFVMSGGLADIKLDRTVNYGSGSYTTRGKADGYALGALYEIGYTQLMNEAGTLAVQPVFNVEVRHAAVKGYTETGSDAGVQVDDIDQTTVTLGAGARMQAVVGQNAWNRYSIFEARMLLKTDLGDRSGTANNALVGTKNYAEVESAEVGAVGVELGAGLTIPLGSQLGSLFMDASVEWRTGQTSFDATVGYRISF